MEEADSCVCGRRKIMPRREEVLADNHMAITEAEIILKNNTIGKRSLLYMENLTLPSVVVMKANMQCNGCRARVSRVVSKMAGLTEYTVDVRKKEVTVKGDFTAQCNFQDETLRSSTLKRANSTLKSVQKYTNTPDDFIGKSIPFMGRRRKKGRSG